MPKQAPRYTVQPGRHIHRNGKDFVWIARLAFNGESGATPTEADAFTRTVVRLLNAAAGTRQPKGKTLLGPGFKVTSEGEVKPRGLRSHRQAATALHTWLFSLPEKTCKDPECECGGWGCTVFECNRGFRIQKDDTCTRFANDAEATEWVRAALRKARRPEYACECCKVDAGPHYYSDDRCNEWGSGVVLCHPCAKALAELPDIEARRALAR